ncbi:mechanosensitive ion channel family protein [Bacillus massiliglaciei]|uniref:mechanosensitive ion channel family protein n=1 Tax=Bacillus massiliglaciei TaxID=1816693 RepID=UPI000AAF5B3B|nr:mechanosensitive ion channel family protein [Bacillus massiliglaciei]
MRWEMFTSVESLKDLGISIGIFVLFLVFRKIFTKYVFALLLKFSRKSPTDFFTHIFLSFKKPIQFLFIIIGIYAAARYFPYFDHKNELFLRLVRASIIFVISWGLYNLSSSSSLLFAKLNEKYNFKIDEILIPFFSRALRVVIVAISFSIIAQEFEYDVNGFVAGLGLGGLAFALAAKDAIGNLFGGIIIITEKPFTIGDWIKTASVEGTVEDISFRSTRVRTFDQALVTVPNATLASESITNWSQMRKRQVSFKLRVEYDTPKDRLENVVRQIEYLLKNYQGVDQETILVRFDEYQDYGYGIMVYFFTETTVWSEYLKIKEAVNFEILDILKNEEVEIALPGRKLYFEADNSARKVFSEEREDS